MRQSKVSYKFVYKSQGSASTTNTLSYSNYPIYNLIKKHIHFKILFLYWEQIQVAKK